MPGNDRAQGGLIWLFEQPFYHPNDRLPTVLARAALTTQPFATPAWTDLSSRLQWAWTVERGRGSELDDFQAGTFTGTFKDVDRHLDPANTSSPYNGVLLPRKRLSVQATWAEVAYDVYDGHVKDWHHRRESGKVGFCDVPATDAFEIFQNETVSTAFEADGTTRSERAEERTDERLGWMLDEVGWPAGRRVFGTGEVRMQPYRYGGVNALGHMRQIEEAENGFLFMDAAGNVVFQDKHKRLRDYATSQATFGDGAGELPYHAFEPDRGVGYIINHATGKLANDHSPREFEYEDAASRAAHGPSAKTLELWSVRDTEAEARTQALVLRYAQPVHRLKSLVFFPQKDPVNLWPQALGRVIGERITVKSRYYGQGSILTQESRIEGIRHDITPGLWRTTFQLSPVFAQELQGYWRVGTAGKSELNLTARLAA